jgi:alpha-tubulin suppressor-like RCC1 family protein
VASGEAYCWGANDAGQLGLGTTLASAATPQPVSGGHQLGLIAAGGRHSCGTLVGAIPVAYCWGKNDEGQLGDGTTVDRSTPVPVADYHP